MLLENYVGPDGQLDSHAPTWSQFRDYYYDHDMHKGGKSWLERDLPNISGITGQRGDPLPDGGYSRGGYQMNVTQADIYLVPRKDVL